MRKSLKVVGNLGLRLLTSAVKIATLIVIGVGVIVTYQKVELRLAEKEQEKWEKEYRDSREQENPVISRVKPLVEPIYSPLIAIGDINSSRYNCSAFVISANYALTAAHCVTDSKGRMIRQVKIYGTDASTEKVVRLNLRGTVISKYYYAGLDMAAINGDFREFQSARTINDVKEIKFVSVISFGVLGDQVTIQYLSLKGPYMFGIIAAGAVFPGMSGGPVMDAQTGIVIGINSAMTENGALVAPLHEWKHYLNLKEMEN